MIYKKSLVIAVLLKCMFLAPLYADVDCTTVRKETPVDTRIPVAVGGGTVTGKNMASMTKACQANCNKLKGNSVSSQKIGYTQVDVTVFDAKANVVKNTSDKKRYTCQCVVTHRSITSHLPACD